MTDRVKFRKRINQYIILCVSLVVTMVTSAIADDTSFEEVPFEAAGSGLTPNVLKSTGAATMSIPIAVPSGKAGLAPSLSLNYSSYSGNGILGVGWSLDLGAITVSTKNGECCEASCREYVAGGKKLVAIGGNEYAPEIENGSFSKYFFDGSVWTVYAKDGNILTYGASQASRLGDAGNNVKWCLDKVEDPNGNAMEINYTKTPGDSPSTNEIYLKEIHYLKENGTYYNKVVFSYEARTDKPIRYEYCRETITTHRMIQITNYTYSPVLSEYEIAGYYKLKYYYNSHITHRSVLDYVQQYGADNTALPKIDIDSNIGWDTLFANGQQKAWPIPDNSFNSNRFWIGDFNGDGQTDIVSYKDSSLTTFFSDSLGLFTQETYPIEDNIILGGNSLNWVKVGDYDGDGDDDLLYFQDDTNDLQNKKLITYFSNKDGSYNRISIPAGSRSSSGYSAVLWNPYMVLQGDFNADGIPDLFSFFKTMGDAWYYRVLLFNGNGSYTFASATNTLNCDNWNEYWVKSGDFNGDGKTDIVTYKNNVLTTLLYNGDGTFTHATTNISGLIWDSNKDKTWAGDLNGDGLTDLISYKNQSLSTFFAKGDGTFDYKTQSFSHLPYGMGLFTLKGTKVGDFNNDGIDDILTAAPTNSQWSGYTGIRKYYSNGDGTYRNKDRYVKGERIDLMTFLPGDLDGDGLEDIIYLKDNRIYSYLTGGSTTDLMYSLKNGQGGSTKITYKPTSYYENKHLPYILQVVSSVTQKDGIGSWYRSDYSYNNGYHDYEDREFRGFETVSVSSPDMSKVTSEFNVTDKYFNHRAHTEKNEYKDAQLFKLRSKSTLKLDKTSLGNGRYYVFVDEKTDSVYADDGETSVTTDYTYSSEHGFATQIITSGMNAESTVIDREFTNYGTWSWLKEWETLKPYDGSILRRTDFKYDAFGNLEEKENWYKEGAELGIANPKVTMTYDDDGNLETATNPGLKVSVTEYDPFFNTYPVKITLPATKNPVTNLITNAHSTQYSDYDYRFGKARIKTDANGIETISTFDGFGRTTNTYINAPGGGSVTTEYIDYINANSPFCVITSVKENDTNTIASYTYYDGMGRKLQTITKGEGDFYITSIVKFDNMGRVEEEVGPFKVIGTDYVRSVPDGIDCPATRYVYNVRGELSEINRDTGKFTGVTPEGKYAYEKDIATTAFTYNAGYIKTITDPDGAIKQEKGDYLGRLIEVKEYNDADVYTTTYKYNIAGDLVNVIDHMNNTTTIFYDSLGRKKGMIDPDMGTWSYTYDLTGNLKTQTDANVKTIQFNYDAQNRLTEKIYETTGEHTITYTYDTADIDADVTMSNGVGRLYSVSNGTVKDTCPEYDAMGNVKQNKREIDGSTYTTKYAYDLAGKLSEMIYPGENYTVAYQYHPGTVLLSKVSGYDGDFASFTEYDVTGQIGQIAMGKFGSTTAIKYTYETWSKQMIGYIDEKPDNSDYQNRFYAYTKAGDISSITDNRAGKQTTVNYEYDKLHRLIFETTTGADTPEPQGATLIQNVYGSEHVHTPVQTIRNSGGSGSYSYDDNGNMASGPDFSTPAQTTVPVRSITYNGDNMPESIKRDGVEVAAIYYDGNGKRAKKVENGNTTIFIGNYYKIQNGTPIMYIFGGNQRLASVVDNGSVFERTYYHKDHLGSTLLMTDDDGNTVGIEIGYKSFGEDKEPITSDDGKHNRFTDQEYDFGTGLYNYNARLYDPVTGMFITADSIVPGYSNPQNLNRYSYCRNNPVNYTDPSGHKSIRQFRKRVSAKIRGEWDNFRHETTVGKEFTRVLDDLDLNDITCNAYVGAEVSRDGGGRSERSERNNEEEHIALMFYYKSEYGYLNYNPFVDSRYWGAYVAAFGGGGESSLTLGPIPLGGTIGATVQRFYGDGFSDDGETITTVQAGPVVGVVYDVGISYYATFSPRGNRESILGDSFTLAGTGGILGRGGISFDFPLGRGFLYATKNFSVTFSIGKGAGLGVFGYFSHAMEEN